MSLTESAQAIEDEARGHLRELQTLQQEFPPGDPAREQKEDAIYQRLSELAQGIQTLYQQNPEHVSLPLHKLYVIIMQRPLDESFEPTPFAPAQQKALPLMYGDRFQFFPKTVAHPKVALFIQKMAQDLGHHELDPQAIHTMLASPFRDGFKDVLREVVHSCERHNWWKHASKDTCSSCWREVMQRVFIMLVEVAVIDIKVRAEQLEQMVKDGDLPVETALALKPEFFGAIKELKRLVKARSPTTKEGWAKRLEEVYHVMIHLINELMGRYIQQLHIGGQLPV